MRSLSNAETPNPLCFDSPPDREGLGVGPKNNGQLAPSVGELAAVDRDILVAATRSRSVQTSSRSKAKEACFASGVLRDTEPGASLRRVQDGPRTARYRVS
jgi:hypothetical protein